MSFRFQLSDSIDVAFRRLVLEQIDAAEHELTAGEDRAVAVHETRKAMKRIRSLLRLVRGELGQPVYARQNARFRAVGEKLAGSRDRYVMLQTAAKLEAEAAGGAVVALARLRGMLAANGGHGVSSEDVAGALQLLREGRSAIAAITFQERGFAAVQRGLRATYRSGRQAFHAAYAVPEDEAFHEWRKAVQRHWRQMVALEVCWPDAMRSRAAMAKRLSQLLGDDHDLAVLAAFAATHMEAETAQTIVAAVRAAQAVIRKEAEPLGLQLYCEKPKAFGVRMARYWQAAEKAAAQKEDAEKAAAQRSETPTAKVEKAAEPQAAGASSRRRAPRKTGSRPRRDGK